MFLEFYGTECPHCINMHPLVERLEKEEGVKVEKYEVWHNEENAKKMREYAEGKCMGVPPRPLSPWKLSFRFSTLKNTMNET